jgi:heme/copper-type cytochrome/quinol oxidase subunit 4
MARSRTGWPAEKSGKTALRSTAIAFLLAIALLALTPWVNTTWGIEAAWILPQIGCAAIIVAAAVNFVTYLILGQRSVANVISLSITATFSVYCVFFFWISQAAGN